MHKHLRLIRVIDDLIGQKDIAANTKSSFTVEYTIQTMKDEKVCAYCQSMNGKVFSPDKAIIGVNYPPFDKCTCDFCRCWAFHELVERKSKMFSFLEKFKKQH